MSNSIKIEGGRTFIRILFITIVIDFVVAIIGFATDQIHIAIVLLSVLIPFVGCYFLEKHGSKDLSRTLYILTAAATTVYFEFYFGGETGSRNFLIPWSALSFLLFRNQSQWLQHGLAVSMLLIWILLVLFPVSSTQIVPVLSHELLRGMYILTQFSLVSFALAATYILEKENSNYIQNLDKLLKELKNAQNLLVYHGKMSAVGQMAAEMAHEINNPLTVIRTQATLEKMAADKSQERSDKIIEMVDRIFKIVSGIKLASHFRSEEPFIDTSVRDIVNDAVELCRPQFNESGIRLKYYPPEEDFIVKCRPAQIIQVLVNLLNNAADAVSDQQDKWVRVLIHDAYRYTDIKVLDSGPGISPENLNNIFSSFFTTKAPGKGTGLGLSISRNIIQDHKGMLFVDVKEPNTAFVVRLKK